MKDVFGVKIEVGQYVAYAVRSCNSGSLRIGVVKKIRKDSIGIAGAHYDEWNKRFNVSGVMGTFSSFDNIVVIPESIVPDEVRMAFGTFRNVMTSS